MNPILLKPEGQARAQVIVGGKVYAALSARDYEREKPKLWPLVYEALARLRAAYDVVVIEGAGSPAEINLKAAEIVNMRVAREAEAPVLLVGDIDRGGVFAALQGTLALLEAEEREHIGGPIVNKLRGDPTLLGDGPRQLEEITGKPVLGIIPYLPDLRLPEEDSVALERRARTGHPVPEMALDLDDREIPALANVDGFDPLEEEPGVSLRYVRSLAELGRPHAVFLPGTKNTLAALVFLDATASPRASSSWRVRACRVGLCGGYQLLGKWVADPLHIEGRARLTAHAPGSGSCQSRRPSSRRR